MKDKTMNLGRVGRMASSTNRPATRVLPWVMVLAATLPGCAGTSAARRVPGVPRGFGSEAELEESPALVGKPHPSMSMPDGPAAGREPDQQAELAKKLSNPVAALISVPIQVNLDEGIGPADADWTTINVQPVIPFSISEEWNVISRTIVPIIDAESPVGGDDESGLGDVLQSFFFSPKAPTDSGWIWGVGPVLLFPTATEDELGGEKWGAGPTAVVLKQQNGWTWGALANHIWSFAGEEDRADRNVTFIQPFLSFTTRSYTTFTVNTESTYDWRDSNWTVPLNLQASQLFKLGGMPISLGVGYREYLEVPDGGPDSGLRFVLTFLFPKG